MEVTGKEIAQKLGISTATVSLALNDRPGVNPQTKAAVLACRDQLQKSSQQTPVRSKKVIILNDMELAAGNDFGLFQISYMELFRVLNEHGYLLQVQVYERRRDAFQKLMEKIEAEEPAGIILFAVNMPRECLPVLKSVHIPMVIFDHNYHAAGADNLLIDNENGVRQAMEYFFENNPEKIYYISHPAAASNNYNFRVRRRTFREILDENPDIKGETITFGSRIEEIQKNAENFLKEHNGEHIGILMENFLVSLGFMRALQSLMAQGYALPDIPGQLLPVSFDEIPDSSLMPVQIPMVRVPHISKARIGVERLIDRMEGRAEEEIVYMVHTTLQ